MKLSTENTLAVLSHLIGSELAKQRNASTGELVAKAVAGGPLRDGPLAVDSIEQLSLARVVNEFFDLETSGLDEWLLRRDTIEQWLGLITESLEQGTTQIGFRSGGTTGDPKINRRPIPHLEAEAVLIAEHFYDRRRIIGIAPPHHIYGFIWGPLLADNLGIPYYHNDVAQQQGLDPVSGDLIVGFPEWWRYRSGRRTGFNQGIAGVTSTAPCPPDLIRALRCQGLDSMTEVYGSSETAGIGWRCDPGVPFKLLDHWDCADDGDGDRLYLRPLSTTIDAPDTLEWVDERTLIPGDRRDGAVQVAGTNVDPTAVAEALKNQADVTDCTVRPFDTGNGVRLKAFVVPDADSDTETLEQSLRRWAQDHLTAPERPVRFDFGEMLPRNELGKLSDW
ncbi:hypothetical protein [Salicola sp. Rm-C-2C1-2]|uniref:AMP-binding enzyme n=1 Tax=Salicola sp. Rm-C-2C1-2 TaxID=3141321 RepID=UPI0032E50276